MNSTDYGPRDFIGYGRYPPNPKWPENARIAVQLVLNYEEGGERCILDGDAESEAIASELGPGIQPLERERNVNIESIYEYGSRVGVWRLINLFKELGVKCTCYGVGLALLKNPDVGKALVEEGHEVGSHGHRWTARNRWTEQEEMDNVRKAINAVKQTTGRPPRGLYYGNVTAPAAERSRALVARVFKEEGLELKWYADAYNDDLPYWIPYPGGSKDEGLLIVPYTLDNNDYKTTQAMDFTTSDNFFQYLRDSFDELYREGDQGFPKMMSVGLHARMVGRPGRVAGLRRFLEYIKSKPGVWIATREEIADHWMKEHPYKPSE